MKNTHEVDLSALVREMIDRLSTELPKEEYENGWTEEGRKVYYSFFTDLWARINSETTFSEEELARINVARSMDHWGIVKGELLEMGSTIWVLLRNEVLSHGPKHR